MSETDDAHRTRLEGRAELLEATLLRYRALKHVLGAVRWRARVRAQATLLREVARTQPRVDEALAAVARKAAAEGWSPRDDVVRCAREVSALRDTLARLARRRLGPRAAAAPLGEQLEALERAAVVAPRLVLPGQRWPTAIEVLPASLPELEAAARFGALLEGLFKRPLPPAGRLGFQEGELEALEAAWPAGEAALEAAWARVRQVDAAGTLQRYLRRRARRMPLHPPRNGAEQLLFTEFWAQVAQARLAEALEARVSPVVPQDAERFALLRWLWRHERDGAARLEAPEVPDARAGLLELAHALLHLAPGARWSAATWQRLRTYAARADRGPPDEDAARLRDNLRLFLRVLARGRAGGWAEPDPATLVGLVDALQQRLEAARAGA